MDNQISSENTSFAYLKSSSHFLNIVMNNINSCVLLLDNQMRLQAFNDSMKTIFRTIPKFWEDWFVRKT
ncbi:MAG: hypothetical protein K9H15_14825 [Bacteroidales bacterium]|nr:hypothetical protein [Bacteroidales bacterium]